MPSSRHIFAPRRSVRAALAALAVSPAAGAAPTAFTITEIPLPPGAVAASAHGINAAGDVAGYVTLTTGATRAFVFSGGTTTLLPPLPGQSASIALDISDGGLVVGYSSFGTSPDKAVTWSGGVAISLGTFGGAWSAANGCSSSGLVAGWALVEQTSTRFHGFVHDGAVMCDVGLLPSGVVTDLADINSSGVAVGIGQTIEGHFHAIMVDPVEGMLDLGTLGGLTSEAGSISDGGHVTGRAQTGVPDAATFEGITRHAFLWHGGRMIDLGALPRAGLIESRGRGVNSKGQVVGEAHDAGFGARTAFLWADGVMTDLNDLVPAGSGWALRTAAAINEAGWIAGDGALGGQARAYLLQPAMAVTSSADAGDAPRALAVEAQPAAGSAPAAPGRYFVVRSVGPLPGVPGPTWAMDVNDAGAVLGMAHVDGSRASRCFLFEDGRFEVFASEQGHPFIWSGAINASGRFTGTQMVSTPLSTKREAFVGAAEFLPDLFPQFPSVEASYGRGINDASPPWAVGSQRLGATIGIGAHSTFGAYLVLLDGNPNPAIALTALGGVFRRAEAINDARDVVGVSLTPTGPLRAFLRPGGGGGATVNLGTLGGSHSWATDVNQGGAVVGWSRLADGGTRAFRFADAALIDLGTLGGELSEAHGINDAGDIVGMSFDAGARSRAFLHDGAGMVDLNERIAPDAGWSLQVARLISAAGLIAGWGRREGETRGFLLTPRGPGDATLDGAVDVGDLIAVMIAWGDCAAPCPADLDGSGAVDVDDLVMVITSWM